MSLQYQHILNLTNLLISGNIKTLFSAYLFIGFIRQYTSSVFLKWFCVHQCNQLLLSSKLVFQPPVPVVSLATVLLEPPCQPGRGLWWSRSQVLCRWRNPWSSSTAHPGVFFVWIARWPVWSYFPPLYQADEPSPQCGWCWEPMGGRFLSAG